MLLFYFWAALTMGTMMMTSRMATPTAMMIRIYETDSYVSERNTRASADLIPSCPSTTYSRKIMRCRSVQDAQQLSGPSTSHLSDPIGTTAESLCRHSEIVYRRSFKPKPVIVGQQPNPRRCTRDFNTDRSCPASCRASLLVLRL